jgi:hypothetical protein
MSVTKQHLSQLSKPCAAKGCSNPGIHEMEIVFLGRKGWFCEECKDGLMRDGLLLQQQAVDSILDNQTTKMGKASQVTSRQTQTQPNRQDMQTYNNTPTQVRGYRINNGYRARQE